MPPVYAVGSTSKVMTSYFHQLANEGGTSPPIEAKLIPFSGFIYSLSSISTRTLSTLNRTCPMKHLIAVEFLIWDDFRTFWL
jgi:hypothetical protein